jgi:large subunit ribosomal protein L29
MAKKVVLTDLADVELVEKLAQAKDELFKLSFQSATGQLDNHARIGQVRKEIARINTTLRVREIAAADALAAAATVEETV